MSLLVHLFTFSGIRLPNKLMLFQKFANKKNLMGSSIVVPGYNGPKTIPLHD